MSNRPLSVAGTVVKQLLGAFFIFSALAKFVSIEKFSVYIFSYQFFSLNLSIIASWVVISTELLLGVAMISNRHHNLISIVNILLLLGFTLFLAYAHLSGRTDSCHCLGDILPFNPIQSILKNASLLLLSLFAWKFTDREWHPQWWLSLIVSILPAPIIFLGGRFGWMPMTVIDFFYTMVLALCAVVMTVMLSFRFANRSWVQILIGLTPYVAVMILSTWVSLFARKGDSTSFNSDYFTELVHQQPQLEPLNNIEGRHLVAFFSPTCPYCKIAAQKLTMIQKRHGIPNESILAVFPGDSIVAHEEFYYAAQAAPFNECSLNYDDFIKLTYGQLPVIALLDGDSVIITYTHSDISEQKIANFLGK